MKIRFLATALLPPLLALPLAAAAQNTGELWEITMSIPGMPAGMMPAQRVCQGDDPERAAQQQKGRDQKDCKVTDRKQSGNRTTVSMSCSDGSTMVIDQQFNAARTEFKSTMSLKSKKDGDMTMTQTGRKVGACDVQQAAREREEKIDAVKKQQAAAMAQGAAAQKQFAEGQIKQCAAALESMNWAGLGVYGRCYNKKDDASCKRDMDASNKISPEIAKSCNARVPEFCRRFQTQEGFLKARADESAAQICGVTTASIKAAQCPKAAQTSLAFLGAYCPVEAKPVAQEHCTGRDYTSRNGGKYARFCEIYLASNSLEKPPTSATDQVKQGVSKGIDKLKGLFGR